MSYVDFRAVKAAVTIERAAKLLNLEVKPSSAQLRGPCPACGNDDPRILAITPAKGVYYCHDAQVGGDCISLTAHILSLSMKDAAEWLQETIPQLREEPHTSSPQRQEARKEVKKETTFDPAAFAAKLAFTDEVEALGLTEADAARLGIGFYRGRVYFPMKDDTGFIAGFIGFANGELKMPPRWLDQSKVVKLKRA